MPFLLETFNAVLFLRNEEEITQEEASSHPMFVQCRKALEETTKHILSQGWWFNTVVRTLEPSGGSISLPADALMARPYPEQADLAFIAGKLTCTLTGELVTTPTRAKLFLNVPYEHLPWLAWETIKLETVLRCSDEFLNGNDKSNLAARAAEARIRLKAEDIMQRRRNVEYGNRHIRRIRSAAHAYRSW